MTIKYFLRNYPGLFFVTFIEGGIVMAVEIMGGNILTAYFGTSIYLWSGILGISLVGLAIGYFTGARFSLKLEPKKFYFLIGGISFFTALIPITADYIIPPLLGLSTKVGITMACFFILMPVMILCGMVSPYIIQLITINSNVVGKNAGTVYSVSTAGGIVFTFLTGFLLMPTYGIRKSILMIAGLFLLSGVSYILLKSNKKRPN